PRADSQTKTFRIEIAISNPEGKPSGTSIIAKIPKRQVLAHFISPGLLTLDQQGNVGVKSVTEEGLVAFHKTKIISSITEGIYVTGLPKRANIIVTGQGFVSDGDKVTAVNTSDIKKAENNLGNNHEHY
ncbi:MAG: hypothetical protein PHW94_09430, partial [Sulfurimonas sp.]|nr:hypothetical protein [Sulfurimonas sp.]